MTWGGMLRATDGTRLTADKGHENLPSYGPVRGIATTCLPLCGLE